MADDLWSVISDGALTDEETTTLTTLLSILLRKHGTVGSAIGYTDEERTATEQVFNVTIIEPTANERGAIVGSVYEHPARMVVAVLNQPGGGGDVEVGPTEAQEFDKMIADFATT